MFASLYLFNPATVVNCSLWGQVDSVSLFNTSYDILREKKMIYSYFMFAICIFLKPQAFIFYAYTYIRNRNVFIKDFSKEKLLKNLGFGVSAIILMVLLALPFGISNVIDYTHDYGVISLPNGQCV